MATVNVPEDYRIEIPQDVREALGIEPGQTVRFVRVGDTFQLVRIEGVHALRGILKGCNLSDYREKEDRH